MEIVTPRTILNQVAAATPAQRICYFNGNLNDFRYYQSGLDTQKLQKLFSFIALLNDTGLVFAMQKKLQENNYEYLLIRREAIISPHLFSYADRLTRKYWK